MPPPRPRPCSAASSGMPETVTPISTTMRALTRRMNNRAAPRLRGAGRGDKRTVTNPASVHRRQQAHRLSGDGHVPRAHDGAQFCRGAGTGCRSRAHVRVSAARADPQGRRQLIGRDLYFGEYLDLPPHTEIVEKAPRLLGVAPTPLERALDLSELRRFCDPLANRQVCDDRSKAATSDLFRFRDHLLARSRKRFGCSALRVTEQLGSNRTELRTDVRVDHLAGFGAGVSMTTIMNVAIGPRRRDARNHAMRLRPFD